VGAKHSAVLTQGTIMPRLLGEGHVETGGYTLWIWTKTMESPEHAGLRVMSDTTRAQQANPVRRSIDYRTSLEQGSASWLRGLWLLCLLEPVPSALRQLVSLFSKLQEKDRFHPHNGCRRESRFARAMISGVGERGETKQ
jgi:hypothetical protein